MNYIENLNIIKTIKNVDFRKAFDDINDNNKDFIFVDPPYLQSIDTNKSKYNIAWTLNDEIDLLELLQDKHDRGFKIMLTNTLVNKGVKNVHLEEFLNKNNFAVKIISTTNNANGNYNNNYLEILAYNYKMYPEFKQQMLFLKENNAN